MYWGGVVDCRLERAPAPARKKDVQPQVLQRVERLLQMGKALRCAEMVCRTATGMRVRFLRDYQLTYTLLSAAKYNVIPSLEGSLSVASL